MLRPDFLHHHANSYVHLSNMNMFLTRETDNATFYIHDNIIIKQKK